MVTYVLIKEVHESPTYMVYMKLMGCSREFGLHGTKCRSELFILNIFGFYTTTEDDPGFFTYSLQNVLSQTMPLL